MAFLLYHNGQIIGCYSTPELLRANILIVLFNLLENSYINSTEFENLSDFLKVPLFTIDNFNIPELKTKLKKLAFSIEKVDHEGSGRCALENILEHIKYRFCQLEEKMEKDSRVKVKIPGTSSVNHHLGTMYYDQWKLFDSKNCDKITKAMHEFITGRIDNLVDKYGDRVEFGDVLYQNASDTCYQVWSANAVNWNRPDGLDIPGSYQAEEMKYQEEGVFGIVVTPMYGYKNLVPLK